VRLIGLLHIHGADISAPDQHGATPLHYATLMCAQQHHRQQQQQQRDEDELGQRIVTSY